MSEHGDIEIDPMAICQRGAIHADEVMAMRRSYYAEGIVTAEEADALFAINNSCRDQAADWPDLFVEALTDYVVNQAEPVGYVTVQNAAWLMARISIDGVVQSRTELELLVHVLEAARWAPPSLARCALDQVRIAIVTGTGPAAGGEPQRYAVTAAQVQLLRRILYAFAGDAHIGITQAEAEVLFDIADNADETLSDPAWSDLFAKAVASSVMIGSGYQAPAREDVLKEEAWLEEDADTTGFLGRMVGDGLANVWSVWREASAEDMQLDKLERDKAAILVAEPVTQAEAEWLAARIGRDGRASQSELALLKFLKDQSPVIHPALQPLLAAAA